MNNIDQLFQKTIKDLNLPAEMEEIVNYSIFPTGKLFRPKLCFAINKDLGLQSCEIAKLAFSIEIHHNYTLIHDDLPAMDNDDYRRGKESVHKKYGEWRAILAGDGMLNLSYELLSDISSPNLSKLLKVYTNYTGINGLILGQYLDLGQNIYSLQDIVRVHKLKTARLIQLSIIGPLILNGAANDLIEKYDNFSENLGLYFQMQDDLSEIDRDLVLSNHDSDINCFLNFDAKDAFDLLSELKKAIEAFIEVNQLYEIQKIFREYQEKMGSIITANKDFIENKIKIKISEIYF